MRRALAAGLLVLAVSGCAAWPFGRGAMRLAEADRLAREGEWSAAVAAYDDYLARYPDAWGAPRALESRDTLATLIRLRQEVALYQFLMSRLTVLGRVRRLERLR